MTLAVLLSGQGAQGPAMFDLTADLPAAASIFAAAAARLDGEDPRALVRRAGADLHANRTGQILCVTAALAGWRLIADAVPGRSIVAGYSIGDLAAWGVAGRIGAAPLLDLAAARAEAMDAAAGDDQGLAGIRGLPLDRLEALAAEHGAELAIRNASDSGVFGGPAAALEALCAAASGEGAARAVRLDVRVPSHTRHLAAASARLRPVLEAAPLDEPPAGTPRLLSGLDGATVFSARSGLDKLARQISEPIDWAACLAACGEYGATACLELGPGHALARMAEAALPGTRTRAIEEFSTAAGIREWLSKTAG